MRFLTTSSIFLLCCVGSTAFAAKAAEPFRKVDAAYSVLVSSKKLDNLPGRRCQGETPTCGGTVGAFVADEYNCRVNGIKNCAAELTPDKQVSSLSVMSWNRMNAGALSTKIPSSYTSLSFNGSASTSALQNAAASVFTFKSEACYPLDRLVKKYASEDVFQAKLADLKSLYEKNKGKTELETCERCILKSVEETFDLTLSQDMLRSAMQKDTFDEFVYKIVFSSADCKTVGIKPKPYVAMFPGNKEESATATPSDLLAKTQEVLNLNMPVILNEICLAKRDDGSCIKESFHGVVLTGHGMACKPRSTDCRPVVRVQNSWCDEKWEKTFGSEPWVDAEALMNNVGDRPNPLHIGILTWLR